jgi:hypothetical protein
LVTPGFLENGINFTPLAETYLANNGYVEITDPAEVNLARRLMRHVIDTSYGYNDDSSDFAQTEHGRFQMIFNSVLQELILNKRAGFGKRSSAIWLLTDSYEKGTDFQSANGKQIEAKVYKNWNSMIKYSEKGSRYYEVFHGADYVLCYLIDSYKDANQESKHWCWLKKINGIYTVYNNDDLTALTEECLPAAIQICYCKFLDDKIIIRKSTYCI